jgi:hypothetical protein
MTSHTLTRRAAIDEACRRQLANLDAGARSALLTDWWNIDEDDAEFHELPEELREEMRTGDPPSAALEARYELLLVIALRTRFKGVRNEYIAAQLRMDPANIDGPPERLHPCPCCGYRTIEQAGEYDICPACYWEDDGTVALTDYSSPNHMTLGDAQAAFRALGAISAEMLRHVDDEASLKYLRDDEPK